MNNKCLQNEIITDAAVVLPGFHGVGDCPVSSASIACPGHSNPRLTAEVRPSWSTVRPSESWLSAYYEKCDRRGKELFGRPINMKLTHNIFETEKTKENRLNSRRQRRLEMDTGTFLQFMIGNFMYWENIGKNHKKTGLDCGLDCVSHTRKIIMEVKARDNTDCSASRKTNRDKLAKSITLYPNYTRIYLTISSNTKKTSEKGFIKQIIHRYCDEVDGVNEVEIEHHCGIMGLRYVFGSETEAIIDFIKETIDKYLPDIFDA